MKSLKFTDRAPGLGIVIVLSILWGCTENPFDGSGARIEADRRTLNGQVTLSDGESPEQVFVWLEELNLSARTDADGNYSLSLLSGTGGTSGTFDGIFSLYYYVANYRYETRRVAIRDGEFVFGEEDLGVEGTIDAVRLEKLLEITTTLSHTRYRQDWSGNNQITFRLQALSGPVQVATYKTFFDDVGGYFVEEINDTCRGFVKRHGPGFGFGGSPSGDLTLETVSAVTVWESTARTTSFPVGKYRLFPYLRIIQTGVPLELINQFGFNAFGYDVDYLNIPFRRNDAEFELTPPNFP